MRRLLVVALLGAAASVGRAAVVAHLTPAELQAGADAVVDGVVTDVTVDWDATGRRLETTVTIRVERLVAGAAPDVVRVVQPGGTLGAARHVVFGLPELTVGEEARYFLRQRPDGRGYRIYGWAQGVWPRGADGEPRPADAEPRPADGEPRPADGEPRPAPAPPRPFTYNGMLWPPDLIPVQYLINRAGTPDLPYDDAVAAIHAAFATWAAVPCSSLTYAYAGETDLGMAVDGQNVILWIEDPAQWIYGEEAAAATSLWHPSPEEATADVAFNGVDFVWAIGPPGYYAPHTLDVQAVLTHELGHLSGLSHTESAIDTMYFSWRPWQSQRTLSADDKLGLCSLYPQPGDECTTGDDCPAEETCDTYQYGTLCTRHPDPIGAPCNYDRVECESFCLFTQINLSDGYCSRYCEVDAECPDGFHCDTAAAGTGMVRACFVGPPHQDGGLADRPPVDDTQRDGTPDLPGPRRDGAGACDPQTPCAAGQYCQDGHCTFDCRSGADCPSGTCGADGRCAGGGCAVGGTGAAPLPAMILALLAACALGCARRRVRRP